MVSECGAVKLAKDTRDLIESLGSNLIQNLGYREPFALIGCWSKQVNLLEDKNQKLRNRFAIVKNFDWCDGFKDFHDRRVPFYKKQNMQKDQLEMNFRKDPL